MGFSMRGEDLGVRLAIEQNHRDKGKRSHLKGAARGGNGAPEGLKPPGMVPRLK